MNGPFFGASGRGVLAARLSAALLLLASISAVSACTGTSAASTGTLPSATSSSSATPAVSPTAPTNQLPEGDWTTLHWSQITTPIAPLPTNNESDSWEFKIFGWSGGYVGFRETWHMTADGDLTSASIVPSVSADGMHWRDGQALSLPDPDTQVVRVVEGPAGLLAVGWISQLPTCGGPPFATALWLSTDGGADWTPVSVATAFGSDRAMSIKAGSAGYIATGTGSGGAVNWISTDGIQWTRHPLSAFTNASVQSEAAFAGGFVMAGTIIGEPGCGDTTIKSVVWWSTSGLSWRQATLGTFKAATDGGMLVTRITDRELIAIHTDWGTNGGADTAKAWVSADGKQWTSYPLSADAQTHQILTNGTRGIALPNSLRGDGGAVNTVLVFQPDMSLEPMKQLGALPLGDQDDPVYLNEGQVAFGPAGILVVDGSGSRFWLGVPAAQ